MAATTVVAPAATRPATAPVRQIGATEGRVSVATVVGAVVAVISFS
jgi:hypothetical protein